MQAGIRASSPPALPRRQWALAPDSGPSRTGGRFHDPPLNPQRYLHNSLFQRQRHFRRPAPPGYAPQSRPQTPPPAAAPPGSQSPLTTAAPPAPLAAHTARWPHRKTRWAVTRRTDMIWLVMPDALPHIVLKIPQEYVRHPPGHLVGIFKEMHHRSAHEVDAAGRGNIGRRHELPP